MVYCGKPSKGCEICRKRKIRCDVLPSGCSQCKNAGRKCPKYRSQVDLMFRNESNAVEQKAKAKDLAKRTQSSRRILDCLDLEDQTESRCTLVSERKPTETKHAPPTEPSQVSDGSSWKAKNDGLSHVCGRVPDCCFATELDERGRAFFFQHFVLATSSSSWGHFTILPAMFGSSNTAPQLLASVNAVGVAAFSNIWGTQHLLKEARKLYINALNLTNAALRSPSEGLKDTTLMAVMVLGQYEIVNGYGQGSLQAWEKHVQGAASMVQSRGYSQFSSQFGVQMFLLVMSNVLISCIQREERFPRELLGLRNRAAQLVDPSYPAWRVSEAIQGFLDLRWKVKTAGLSDPAGILAEAEVVDASFSSILLSQPKEWSYHTVYTDSDPHIVWDGHYHVYNECVGAQVANTCHVCKILVNEIIRNTLFTGLSSKPPVFLDPRYLVRLHDATNEVFRYQAKIFATVPQHLGYVKRTMVSSSFGKDKFQHSDHVDSAQSNHTGGTKNPSTLQGPPSRWELSAQTPGAYFLLWPLYSAGATDIAKDEVQQWVANCLRYLSRVSGIRQATMLAETLELKRETNLWRYRESADHGTSGLEF